MHWKESSPVPHPKGGYIAGTAGKRYLLAGGGYWEGGVKKWSRGSHWYDPEADAWAPGPDLPEERGDAACVSHRGAIYSFGGGADNTVNGDVLELRDGAWKERPEWSLPEPRLYAVAAVAGPRVYVVGGIAKAGDYSNIATTVWSRDLNQPRGEWKQHRPIPGPPRAHFALAALGGRLFLFGGYGPAGNFAEACVYDIAAEAWRSLPGIPTATRAWWAVPDSRRVLLLGGYTSDFSAAVHTFDPATGGYEIAGQLPHALADAKFMRVGKWLVTAGGEPGMKRRGPWTLRAEMDG